jgi:hypothetical protein
MEIILGPITGLLGDLPAFVAFSQILQGEGLKLGVEHFRRGKPYCSGLRPDESWRDLLPNCLSNPC